MTSRIIRICDRCKKKKEPSGYNAEWDFIRNSSPTDVLFVDLCPKCVKEFRLWLKI